MINLAFYFLWITKSFFFYSILIFDTQKNVRMETIESKNCCLPEQKKSFYNLMSKIKAFYLLIFLTLSAFQKSLAQAPKYSNEFLQIGVGAKSLGMSNASVASVGDVTAGYWNPAGLVNVRSLVSVGLMHSEYFAGIAKYDYLGIAHALNPNTSIGLSIIRFGVDNIPNTTELIDNNGNINYDRITKFSAADYAFLLSYSRKTKIEGLRYGANVKIVYRKVGSFANAIGFGLDFGAQYDRGAWKFGLMARDVTSTFNAWSYSLDERTKEVFTQTGNEIPTNSLEVTLPRFILGVGRKTTIYKKFSCYPEVNLELTTDGKRNVLIKGDPISIDPKLGVEFAYSNFVFIRAGVGNFQTYTDDLGKKISTVQPNIGAGFRIKNFFVDYAFTNIGNASVAQYSHVFSLKFDLNKKTL